MLQPLSRAEKMLEKFASGRYNGEKIIGYHLKNEYQEDSCLGPATTNQGRENDMPDNGQLQISNIPEISAIYYALLQLGYEYDSIERDKEHIAMIHEFVVPSGVLTFFSGVKQTTCDVYRYWPRAFILESATFFLKPNHSEFQSFDTFRKYIMSAGNIADNERNQRLWDWIEKFPKALSEVLARADFRRYLEWENRWISQQNRKYATELQLVEACLDVCVSKYNSPVRDIQIVMNPIKCVYASDYHMDRNCFVFCSGSFRVDSVIHEFLHHVVHPAVLNVRETIFTKRKYPAIDASYYLSGDYAGYVVCRVDDGVVWVESIFVGEEYRRCRVASALHSKAEEIAASHGDSTVYNYVHPNNHRMIAFLRKRGYTVLNLIEIRKAYPGEKLTQKISVGEHEFDY